MTITLEVVAILVSIVSFIVTVLGFFASLRFYRNGVEMQQSANDALVKLTEKTNAIQSQVGGMFDKTLDAALGKQDELDASFEDLEEQLGSAKEALLSEVVDQIGEAGEHQQKRIRQMVEEQIGLLQKRVETTRESVEEVTEDSPTPRYQIGRTEVAILRVLEAADKPLTKREVRERMSDNIPLTNASVSRFISNLSLAGLVVVVGTGRNVKFILSTAGKLILDYA